MRILFHAFGPNPRAAGMQQSVRVCYHLARLGAEVHLHLGGTPFSNRSALLRFFGFEDEPRFITYFHPSGLKGREAGPRRVRLSGMAFHLKRLLTLLFTREKRRYDVFLARGHRIPVLHVWLKRWLGYRVVFELHELYRYSRGERDIGPDSGTIRTPERQLWRRADGIIAISESLRRVAERAWAPRDNVVVIPSGAILFEAAPLPPTRTLRRVFYVGNLNALNGIDDLIRAIATLPDITLCVVGGRVGDEDHARVVGLIDEMGVNDRVELRGFVEPAFLSHVYEEADILVAPFTNHIRPRLFASPLKLFEYMSARRPIVATGHATVREILTHERDALLTQPEDPESLAAAIRRLRNDPDLARRLAERAYDAVQQYSMDRKCLKIKKFLHQVLGRTPAKRNRPGPGQRRDHV